MDGRPVRGAEDGDARTRGWINYPHPTITAGRTQEMTPRPAFSLPDIRLPDNLWTLARVAGLVLLVLVPLVARAWGGDDDVDWSRVREVSVSPEECRVRQQERLTAPFTLPDGVDAMTWGEVAAKFRLDPYEVCAANDVPRTDCRSLTLAPGETLDLPLARHGEGPPGRSGAR